MYSCGSVGKERADEVLIRVPLRLEEHFQGSNEPDTEGRIRAGDVVGVLKEVNQTCFEFGREAARRTVCRVGALKMIRDRAESQCLVDSRANLSPRKGFWVSALLLYVS